MTSYPPTHALTAPSLSGAGKLPRWYQPRGTLLNIGDPWCLPSGIKNDTAFFCYRDATPYYCATSTTRHRTTVQHYATSYNKHTH
ncbi:hypothetical protein M8J77_004421 [Diaphorina citri]|nr:hypothetical protein M8J77_004421 [Diaphorina citri]